MTTAQAPAPPEFYKVPSIHITQDDLSALAPALAHDGCGYGALIAELTTGRAQLWRFAAEDAVAVCVTNIQETLNGRELNVWLVAGNGPNKYKKLMMHTFFEYGRQTRCVRLTSQTTPSLAEYYQKTLGFEERGVVISKEIPDGQRQDHH